MPVNALGLKICRQMFDALAAHGAETAKEVRRRFCRQYGQKNVDEAAEEFMRQRQQEFDSVNLWAELKKWTERNYPCGFRYSTKRN
jgi:hypothetical protein